MLYPGQTALGPKMYIGHPALGTKKYPGLHAPGTRGRAEYDLLKRPRLADWHEFARLTQGNSLASVLPSAFWAQDSGFNHSDDMQGSGQT